MKRAFLGLASTLLAAAATALAQPAPPPPPPAGKADPPKADKQPPVQPVPAVVTEHPVPGDVSPCPQFPCRVDGGRNGYWFDAEYLLWFIKNGPLPHELVTTGPPESGGIIFNPGVFPLIGRQGIDYEAFSGGRFSIGRWFADGLVAFEAAGFWLEEDSVRFRAVSNAAGDPLLARPIVNANTGDETSVLVTAPGTFVGGIDVTGTSQFWGAEANLFGNVLRQGPTGIDLLVGFRYLQLDEGLDITSFSEVRPGGVAAFGGEPVLAPNALAIRDSFATSNQFYGGQVGARGTVVRGRLRVDVTGKVAFGAVHQQLRVNGFTTLVAPEGIVGTLPGGVLAQQTNSGRRATDDGAVVPEGAIRVGYRLTDRLTVNVGYTIIYWDNVVRPGDQIDRRVNLRQVPSSFSFGPLTGPRQPAPLFGDSRFWAQGLSFGLALKF